MQNARARGTGVRALKSRWPLCKGVPRALQELGAMLTVEEDDNMADLLGTWSLVSCVSQRDVAAVSTFGDPPAGQLQYSADGRMSAFLMDPTWAAAGNPVADSFTEFFSYGGAWRRDGDMVTHDILFASVPSRVGTSFTRRIVTIDEDAIELVTEPEVSKSGATYVTRLLWKRVTTAR